jgi:superfamily I DNA/RNA helicase
MTDALGTVEGTVGVIVPDRMQAWVDGFARARRVTVVGVRDCKGIEFDAVVIVEPAAIVEEHSMRALYVALTRSTQLLTVIHALPLPSELTG